MAKDKEVELEAAPGGETPPKASGKKPSGKKEAAKRSIADDVYGEKSLSGSAAGKARANARKNLRGSDNGQRKKNRRYLKNPDGSFFYDENGEKVKAPPVGFAIVRFVKRFRKWRPDDQAGFPKHICADLVRSGDAVYDKEFLDRVNAGLIQD